MGEGRHRRIVVHLRLVLVAAALAIAPTESPAVSGAFDSLDWITLTSERIALVRVEAVFDSVDPKAGHTDRGYRYRTMRNLAGGGPERGDIVRLALPPAPQVGDTVLVLWQGEGSAKPSESYQWIRHFSMSHRDARPLFAFSTDFRLIQSPDSVLAAVERRLRMVRANRPLGDDRRWRLRDFMEGRGRLIYWVPAGTEAEAATLDNWLVVPADADRLPAILAESRSSDVQERAKAAIRLKEYPDPAAVARLREMLADEGVAIMEGIRGGVTFKQSAYIVRGQAYRSLTALGVRAPRPASYEADSTYLDTFVW